MMVVMLVVRLFEGTVMLNFVNALLLFRVRSFLRGFRLVLTKKTQFKTTNSADRFLFLPLSLRQLWLGILSSNLSFLDCKAKCNKLK
jgi:hypothetical protein